MSISELLRYRRSRLPVPLVGALTMFLFTAAMAIAWPVNAGAWLLRISLAALLVVQFRLWDDLNDIDSDRRKSPDRVLCQANSLFAYRFVFGILLAVNASLIIVFQSQNALIAFVALHLLLFAWYSFRDRMRVRSVFSHTVVLLKYPMFVYLLRSHTDAPVNWLSASYAMSLTFLCFCIYEILHDHRVGSILHVKRLLMLEMLAMVGVGFVPLNDLIQMSQTLFYVHAGLVTAGMVVLANLFWRLRNRIEPGRWCYTVFFVGFVWLLSYAMASCLTSTNQEPSSALTLRARLLLSRSITVCLSH